MKKLLYTALAVSTLSLVSCKDDFLESSPTQTVAKPTLDQKVNGLYSMMIRMNTGHNDVNYEGASPDHADFGQKGYDIYMDMMCGDMALQGLTYNWYAAIASTDAQTNTTNNYTRQAWRYYYRLINACNEVIDELGGNTYVPQTDEEKKYMGQAKTMRAYAYFYLLQLYTAKYDPSAQAIPVYTSFNPQAAPKSTQAQVYALIIDDLTKSISYLENFNREVKGQVDESIAKGFLAYTYAAMGRNAEAATLARSVINDYGYPLTTRAQTYFDTATNTGGGFNDIATPSWMWGYDIVVLNGLDLVSWWGQIDYYTYSYAFAGDRKGIDQNLYNSIRTDDIRKKQFSSSVFMPLYKFFDPNRKAGGQRQISTDYVFMRVDEFYLLAAETLAKSGQEAQARTILKTLLAQRIADISYIDSLSGTALQNEIYKNTRIELWGEGKSYMAMKRNQATTVRGANHKFLVGEAIPYDDNRMYLKIPQSEVDNNPNF